MLDREGSVDLQIARFRRVWLAELPGVLANALVVEPAPASRHLTRRPNYARTVVESFRHRDRRRAEAGGACGGVGGGRGPV
jgi:hypothetical protein